MALQSILRQVENKHPLRSSTLFHLCLRKDSGSKPGIVSVALHHDLPTSIPPEQWNIVSPVPTQRQELGHTTDLVPTQNQEHEGILVSVPERDQRLPMLTCLNDCNSERGLPTPATYAAEVQQFSCILEESTAVISNQELVTVVFVCSSNGFFLMHSQATC